MTTWHLEGRTWQLCDDGELLATLTHDGEQYRDGNGQPLGRNYDEARRKVEGDARGVEAGTGVRQGRRKR